MTSLWELKDKKVGWQPWIKPTLAVRLAHRIADASAAGQEVNVLGR